jgi:CRP/FNR family transcriptional regulator, cyclic AMP receptor protein
VKESRKAAFDPKKFLAKVGDGKTISKYQKDQIVFSQGDAMRCSFGHPALLIPRPGLFLND